MMHRLKTGAMICRRPASWAQPPPERGGALLRQAAREYGSALGLAFQIRDDMLDVMATTRPPSENPSAPTREEGKVTFVDLLGRGGMRARRCSSTPLRAKAALKLRWRETGLPVNSWPMTLSTRKV